MPRFVDTLIIVVVVLLVVVVSGGAAIAALGMGSWTPSSLPGWIAGRREDGHLAAGSQTAQLATNPMTTVRPVTPAVAPSEHPEPITDTTWHEEWRAARTDDQERLRYAGEQISRLTARLDQTDRELAAIRDAIMARLSAAAANQSADGERLRADVVAALTGRAHDSTRQRVGERRLDVTADLYARLARFEAAVAAVTNPVLLPGEPYEPPAEFLAESLVWENWKDVGDRAFALADGYNADRVYLSATTSAELGTFIGTLRGLLTDAIYPNLQGRVTAEQTRLLRQALGQLATDVPRLRGCLEADLRHDDSPSGGISPAG